MAGHRRDRNRRAADLASHLRQSRPAGVAEATIPVRNVLGSPRRSSSARSQSPFAMLGNWVVEAMVASVVVSPVKKKRRRSGISSSVAARSSISVRAWRQA